MATAELVPYAELVLYAERPVITTEMVPVGRIRISKHLVSHDETLTGTVRREVVEYDSPGWAQPSGPPAVGTRSSTSSHPTAA